MQEESLPYQIQSMPVRRRFLPNDSFFQDGDQYYYYSIQQLTEELQDFNFDGKRESSYENHYNSTHRNVCDHCRKNFPSSKLLEIHVLETHDTLFSMLSQKRNMFECLVDGCEEKFATSDDRLQHLIKLHRYPSNFHFAYKVSGKKKAPRRIKVRDQMDVDEDTNSSEAVATSRNQASKKDEKKIPKYVSFGRGKAKVFQKSSIDKNKRKGKKGRSYDKEETMEV